MKNSKNLKFSKFVKKSYKYFFKKSIKINNKYQKI